MTDAARSVYLGLGRAFVTIGGAVALASLVDRIAGLGFFRASPVGTAALLVVVGVALLWTVAQADRQRDAAGSDEPHHPEVPEVGNDVGTTSPSGQDTRP